MRSGLFLQHKQRGVLLVGAVILASSVALMPRMALAEGLFDFLFGGLTRPQQPAQADVVDPAAAGLQPVPQPRAAAAGSGPAFCVRSCDGRYFPLMRGATSPAQMCQAFCPASATKVYFGASIDSAYAANGESYADSENAYAYRKALRADCTCNGRDPAGLAPVDLALDNSLRAGDVVATSDGLVAYSGPRGGPAQTGDFTPVASYPGLTAEVRARLTELKVAPVRAETVATDMTLPTDGGISLAPPPSSAPKPAQGRDKRAALY
ncbi:DUF2865 domain-containing protein [Bradyrhizobium sp. STM 3557]|uniref:DUF2865 domain-containing protein n=1 Tax=Bradyrhizobium sp. STM 3557 TaxID=578920 RepID=UPI00388F8BA4